MALRVGMLELYIRFNFTYEFKYASYAYERLHNSPI